MYVLSGVFIFLAVFSFGDSLLGIGGGGSVIKGGRFGLGGKAGEAAEGLKAGTEEALQDLGANLDGLFQGKLNFDSSEETQSSNRDKNGKHGKNNKRRKTGRGIDKKTGIGSRDGIATPIFDLLGLTKAVCHISYAGEAAIEKMGDFAIGMNNEMRKFDIAIANYVTDNIVVKAVDAVRRGHNDVVKFIVSTHVGFTKFATNTLISLYRASKAPIRELLAC